MESYIDYCVDCGKEFLKTGPRKIRCERCQKFHGDELNRKRSSEYYYRQKNKETKQK